MRKNLSKSEVKELNVKLKELYNLEEFFNKKDILILEDNLIKKDNELLFFYHENNPVPTLKLLMKNNFLKKITVDMGAVKFVINGADIMRKGIKKIDETIKKGDYVTVIDETHSKPLAVGVALLNYAEMQKQTEGKSIQNIHRVGDELWTR
ncbi:RNA-binding protein [archaeon]|nr:RNA-binding protein [archaeon]